MTERYPKWAVLGLVGGLLAVAPAAMAQSPPGAGGAVQAQQGLSNALYGGAAPTPFTPYLNPYLMQMSPGNQDYLTYMYLANQRAGGIGSGVISGTRPAPGAPAGPAPRGGAATDGRTPAPSSAARNSPYPQPPPGERNRVTMPLLAPGPGANSGGYFMRGPGANQGASRYFNRTSPAGPRRGPATHTPAAATRPRTRAATGPGSCRSAPRAPPAPRACR